jgi:hypothetical protein
MIMCAGQFICCFLGCQHKSDNNLDVDIYLLMVV